jgi:quercetin dioxygenase-like cupin family protein
MKKLSVILGFLVFLLVVPVIFAQDKAGHAVSKNPVLMRPDTLIWGPAPPGLPPGSQMQVLAGGPDEPHAPYVLRAKLPDGYTVPPHWHSGDENVTVLKGALLTGQGDKLDPSKLEELPVDSFWHMPKATRHFVTAKGETIIQVYGIGPFGIHYVNPADDPRKQGVKP